MKKNTLIGITVLSVIILLSCIGPMLTGYSCNETNLVMKNQPPSWQHWFGTDELGRDLFTRTWTGARLSLAIGLIAATIDLLIGVMWGGLAGYCGGRIEQGMMRLADILYSFPYLLCAIFFMVIMESGFISMVVAMTFIGWIPMARIVRGSVMQLRNQEFVLAAKSMGASHARILRKHLLPNAMGPIIVTATLTIPSAIFTEAFLSFLGLGIPAPHASWGTMVSEGVPALNYYPWRLFIPAFFISITMLSFNLLGDGLRDSMDPLKGEA